MARGYGAAHTVVAHVKHVDAVLDLTGGEGAHVVLDFVGEKGTEDEVSLHTKTYPLDAVNEAMDDLDNGLVPERS